MSQINLTDKQIGTFFHPKLLDHQVRICRAVAGATFVTRNDDRFGSVVPHHHEIAVRAPKVEPQPIEKGSAEIFGRVVVVEV